MKLLCVSQNSGKLKTLRLLEEGVCEPMPSSVPHTHPPFLLWTSSLQKQSLRIESWGPTSSQPVRKRKYNIVFTVNTDSCIFLFYWAVCRVNIIKPSLHKDTFILWKICWTSGIRHDLDWLSQKHQHPPPSGGNCPQQVLGGVSEQIQSVQRESNSTRHRQGRLITAPPLPLPRRAL